MARGGRILILGNGFDIDLGLKTSYRDFMNNDQYWPFVGEPENYSPLGQEMKKIKEDNWYDIERALLKFAKSYRLNTNPFDRDPNVFINCRFDYESLVSALAEYLQVQQDEGEINADSVAFRVLKRLLNDTSLDAIYSFNYTEIERILQRIPGLPSITIPIVNVHGKLHDHTLILGVNEKEELNYKQFQYLYKTFNRHYQSNNLRYDILTAQEVIIFGHSLSEVDYSYFEEFFYSLCHRDDDKATKRKVTIFTYDEVSELEIKRWLRSMDQVQIELLYGYNDFQFICTRYANDSTSVDGRRLRDFLFHIRTTALDGILKFQESE